jgi:hypothetical protein
MYIYTNYCIRNNVGLQELDFKLKKIVRENKSSLSELTLILRKRE